jgi:hypothetical protein
MPTVTRLFIKTACWLINGAAASPDRRDPAHGDPPSFQSIDRRIIMVQPHSAPPAQRIDPSATLNEIVAQHPQTMPVFQRVGLDTCCGGALPLQVAVEHHQLNLGDVVAALEHAIKGAAA